ncbi:phosphoribosylglycinamide formyltransferase [Metabacillus arenae]|uniref:Phosphoribosylglycinamide formyltransferase n=1 Tax=Metabacillus arenae TaxID=2771434 RepID=A0A926RXY0_9BACI|nr:phosphoribosylglycinamide formyltransferase [Metabacillus arenae]MBD1382368.1 phosphoribosylglycinamide formyltransferase [Metabacillus arenae]
MMKIAIFASGNGSNFQAIVDYIKAGNLNCSVELLVCDKLNAYVIERAGNEDIPAFSFDPKAYSSKEAFETEITQQLNHYEIDFIVLAGYMRLIGPTLLSAYPNRIINIHPSLLPSFPGKDAVGQAYRAGVKVTGVTVHFVDEGMDTGPIIAQKAIEVSPGESLEDIEANIHRLEHELYPNVIANLLEKELRGEIK